VARRDEKTVYRDILEHAADNPVWVLFQMGMPGPHSGKGRGRIFHLDTPVHVHRQDHPAVTVHGLPQAWVFPGGLGEENVEGHHAGLPQFFQDRDVDRTGERPAAVASEGFFIHSHDQNPGIR